MAVIRPRRTPLSEWLHHHTATLPHSSRIAGWCFCCSAASATWLQKAVAVAKFLNWNTFCSASGVESADASNTGCGASVHPASSDASMSFTSGTLMRSRPCSRMAFFEHGTHVPAARSDCNCMRVVYSVRRKRLAGVRAAATQRSADIKQQHTACVVRALTA